MKMKKLAIVIIAVLLLVVATVSVIATIRAVDKSDEYISYLDRKYGW